MGVFVSRVVQVAALTGIVAALLSAQEWKTADPLPGIDLSTLTAAQKTKVLKLLREEGCTCGCSMKMAECRLADPACGYSSALANIIIGAIKQGKSASEALELAKASKFGHAPEPPPLLEAAVVIPVAGSPVTGPANAAVTIVEFSDFQCPYCAIATPQIEAAVRSLPKQVKLIFKQFPLEMHPAAPMAAGAALAAFKQNKFWEMHDELFAKHDQLSRDTIFATAQRLGLDMKQFEADLNSKEVHESVVRDMQDGDRLGVQGTPTLFINGQKYNGPINEAALKPVLESQLKSAAGMAQASR